MLDDRRSKGASGLLGFLANPKAQKPRAYGLLKAFGVFGSGRNPKAQMLENEAFGSSGDLERAQKPEGSLAPEKDRQSDKLRPCVEASRGSKSPNSPKSKQGYFSAKDPKASPKKHTFPQMIQKPDKSYRAFGWASGVFGWSKSFKNPKSPKSKRGYRSVNDPKAQKPGLLDGLLGILDGPKAPKSPKSKRAYRSANDPKAQKPYQKLQKPQKPKVQTSIAFIYKRSKNLKSLQEPINSGLLG